MAFEAAVEFFQGNVDDHGTTVGTKIRLSGGKELIDQHVHLFERQRLSGTNGGVTSKRRSHIFTNLGGVTFAALVLIENVEQDFFIITDFDTVPKALITKPMLSRKGIISCSSA